MDSADHDYFKQQLHHFGTVHRVSVTAEMYKAYWADLRGMSRADFERACRKLRIFAQWLPKPAEFLAAGRPTWM